MAMFEMKLTGIEEAKTLLSKERIQKILSETVGNTAYDARKDVIQELKEVFDRPTPFILGGVGVRHKQYDPSGLSALIHLQGTSSKRAVTPEDILAPHIVGGGREMKSSEKWLRNYWIPGQGIRLNQYGNVSGGQMTQILSTLKLLPEVGFLGNITPETRKAKKKKGTFHNYFKVGWNNRSGLHAGIWERLGNGRIKPILIFIKNPQYYKRFKFFETIQRSINKNIQIRFNQAFEHAFQAKR